MSFLLTLNNLPGSFLNFTGEKMGSERGRNPFYVAQLEVPELESKPRPPLLLLLGLQWGS
jgi:hypothetical protein